MMTQVLESSSAAAVPADAVLDMRDVSSGYDGLGVLHNLTLQVRTGEIVVLLGANGAGKTTTLKTIGGFLPLQSGKISIEGKSLGKLRPDRRAKLGLGLVPEGRRVFGAMSVRDNLIVGAYLRRDTKAIAHDLDRVYTLFPALAEKRGVEAGALSGGQQQMVAIGRAMMSAPRILLLDEPSLGLAPILVGAIFEAIATLRDEGCSIFLVEQNAAAAMDIADRGYVLETGSIVLSGSVEDLRANPAVRASYLGLPAEDAESRHDAADDLSKGPPKGASWTLD